MKRDLNNKLFGKNSRTFVIAEAGSNHDGDLEQAKKLIDIAVDCGADAVKFQIFKAEKLYHKNVGMIQVPGGKIDFFDFLKKMEMPIYWVAELKEYCKERDIELLFSIFDIQSVDIIKKFDINAIKIASPELNYIQLFEECAKLNKPIIFSTGISKLGDIEQAIETIEKYHSNYAILHCITSYPASYEQCNLNIIKTLAKCFEHPVGLSDHTMDFKYVPALAVAIGASIIEKHFTISRELNGPDHKFALEPNELKIMIKEIRKVETMDNKEKLIFIDKIPNSQMIMGKSRKCITDDERILYECDRRSIISVKDIDIGEIIKVDDVSILRAERNIKPGLEPKFLDSILGKKVTRKISSGEGITWELF
ncbi:N-acetylneuraminate synthase family protein [Clostridium tagluense]|uniref:N-acetylneuraminate synthase family protein n=1 Tax=Clostridium tagluense TaxID=360422 RepID=UPI001CF39084|nr:N-acetylneuraminate synthase family protein [Clostridium tagluense]MCB2310029.1 N-acetylneuraminate synthase family protein [Clostridium tagluense]MCB2314441.1 N-acetylneuraminate synthase family protein [Clostridium tagluense]MCB2319287.1 N-acetylneuraminate synthase family protein [Clostridium tagluense]MCB2324623.1 N-acetylneuraminate synthase family protein [Clostridium tagluense]MCB2329474.1 N-acetylneuraminate synthase family protein [Clostridium tagluense]